MYRIIDLFTGAERFSETFEQTRFENTDTVETNEKDDEGGPPRQGFTKDG